MSVDLSKLTPEQQEVFDAAFAKGKEATKSDYEKQVKEANDRLQARETELLEKLQGKEKMSEADREKYEKELEAIRSSQLTEKEKFERETSKLKSDHEKALKAATDSAAKWQSKVESMITEAALQKAAVEHDAYNPSQLVKMLKSDVVLEPVKDGDNIIDYTPKFKNAKGEVVELSEGVKTFLGENPNLQKSKVTASGHPANNQTASSLFTQGNRGAADVDLRDVNSINKAFDAAKQAQLSGGGATTTK